jgi:hypothetical protein
MQSRLCILFYGSNLHRGAIVCKGERVAAPPSLVLNDGISQMNPIKTT